MTSTFVLVLNIEENIDLHTYGTYFICFFLVADLNLFKS